MAEKTSTYPSDGIRDSVTVSPKAYEPDPPPERSVGGRELPASVCTHADPACAVPDGYDGL